MAPLPKCGSGSSCPSDYHPNTITPVLFKVFEILLTKHLTLSDSDDIISRHPNLSHSYSNNVISCQNECFFDKSFNAFLRISD